MRNTISILSIFFALSAQAEQLKIVDVAGNTRLVSEVEGQEQVGLSVVLDTSKTKSFPVEVRLSGLVDSESIQSIQISEDGRGVFSNVSAGGYQLYSSAGPEAISDLQVIDGEARAALAAPADMGTSQPVVADGVVAGEAGAVTTETTVGGLSLGGGLGTVAAVGGASAIVGTAIVVENNNSSGSSPTPAPSPTPVPPVS